MPLTMTFISSPDLTGLQIGLLVVVANVCGWIPVLLTLSARRENGFATVWDLITGTRVVVKPKGATRPAIEAAPAPEIAAEGADSLGPYRISQQLVPGGWFVGTDPVLRRQVWLLRRRSGELSFARRNLARPGRPRWLQKVEVPGATWDAFEASPGRPFSSLVESGKTIPWPSLRHWLHDLASELCVAAKDRTLPAELSLDHVWITAQGQAVLLDEAWPGGKTRAKPLPVADLAGQQRFLSAVAACVESTSLPLHARSVLQNLERGKFEKLSFLTGTLRGLLDKPATVSRVMRAGSVFLLPLYIWILAFVGYYQGERVEQWSDILGWLVLITVMVVLGAAALVQLLELPLRTTVSHAIFRLAVVNAKGQPAGPRNLWLRWAIAWLPLFLPMLLVAQVIETAEPVAFFSAASLLLLWLSAAVYSVVHPNRGLHDRLAGTWVVRR